MKRRLLAALFGACAALAAQAAEFGVVQPARSGVSFVSKQMGVPVEGDFKKFSAQIAIDPARPEAGRARIDVDLDSVDAGGPLVNDEVKGRDWFSTKEFPTASFVSAAVKSLGGGRFEAAGKMTLKGRTRDFRAPFTLKQEGGLLLLEGSFPLKRLDFGIGSGEWGDPSVVADEVQVKVRFALAPAAK